MQPEPTEEAKKRITDFMDAYGKLVEEYKVDFITYPIFMPNKDGKWEITIQTVPTDTSAQPVKSPFIA